MLDAFLGRKGGTFAALLDAVARGCLRLGLSANHLTYAGLLLGLGGGLLFYLQEGWWALLVLSASGGLDAVDGRVARLGSGPTLWGGVLDLICDRIVEAAVLLGIALPHPEWHLPALVLAATWYVNIGVFLAVGAASERHPEKIIAYPPGLLERSEGLLFALVVVAAPAWTPAAAYLYAALELVTGAQRFRFGRRALAGPGSDGAER
jgi:phosphatidylglycerophosphate synthase